MANAQAIINVGQSDSQLTLVTALPAAGGTAVTGIIDLGTTAPNSNAWRMGRFAITLPAMAGNNAGVGITVTMTCASDNLTASSPAPAPGVPGAFAAPITAQVTTIAAVAVTGTPAFQAYQLAAFDTTGSTFRYYQFSITVAAQVTVAGESLTIGWIKDSE